MIVHWRFQESAHALQMLPGWCGWNRVNLVIDHARNFQFSSPALHISLMDVIRCVPPCRLSHLSSLICFGRKLSMRLCTFLEIVSVTRPSSSSLSLPSTISASLSSSSSPSCSSSEVATSLRLSQIAFNISSNIISGCLVVPPRAFSISHIVQLLHHRCFCILNLQFCHRGFSLHIIHDQYLSLRRVKCAFLLVSPPQASFWIVSCAVLPTLGPILPPKLSCLHSLDDDDEWTALSICRMCQPEEVESSISER